MLQNITPSGLCSVYLEPVITRPDDATEASELNDDHRFIDLCFEVFTHVLDAEAQPIDKIDSEIHDMSYS